MTAVAFLLDTNILIGLAKGPGPAREMLDAMGAKPENSAISQITRIELLSFPGLTDDDEIAIQTLLSPLTVYAIDAAIEQATIVVRRRYRHKIPDAIIVATAIAHGLRLVTLDERLQGPVTL